METLTNIKINFAEDIERYAKNGVLDVLLCDRSTGNNIVWATSAHVDRGVNYAPKSEIVKEAITGQNIGVIKTRAEKAVEDQASLTKSFAEVFTPTWICEFMVNEADKLNDWTSEDLDTVNKKREYIRSKRLEITCGEAPFIVNRYDAADGTVVPFNERIGILDKKLAVVKEIASSRDTWKKWAKEALESVYGYEYQGDNLLIARINVLRTLEDAIQEAGYESYRTADLKKLANIISWNFWQMDGLTGYVPFRALDESYYQPSIFDLLTQTEEIPDEANNHEAILAKIYDWSNNSELEYNDMQLGRTKMKFDFVIGNPPYQEESVGDQKNFAPPVYHRFMDGAYEVSRKVELIHPARFLFNAGSTPSAWNKKMLNDVHFKVLDYSVDSRTIFPNQDIKGGIAITYRDLDRNYGPIETFTPFEELNSILKKVSSKDDFESFSEIVRSRTVYRLTDEMHRDFPEARDALSDGHDYDMATNIFETLPQVFTDNLPNDNEEYIQIYGRENGKRTYKYIKREYVNKVDNLDRWKIFVPKSNGSGALGEVLTTPLIGQPLIGHTESFISIGSFETQQEAQNALKYIKAKFCRVMLGILKVTQDNPPKKWKYVPLQDFTSMSDIDWLQSVSDIDKQLYKKYGLSEEEIQFIESHVKEMD